jgi:hypothetical protein
MISTVEGTSSGLLFFFRPPSKIIAVPEGSEVEIKQLQSFPDFDTLTRFRLSLKVSRGTT